MLTLQLPAFAQLMIVVLLNKELNLGLCVDTDAPDTGAIT